MDIQDKFRKHLLRILMGLSRDVKAVYETLQSEGLDINASDEDDVTPLQMVAAFGHDELLELLIANNALIDEQNALGWTPLMQAIRNGHVSCVQKLIASGANLLLKTRMGVDILSLAAASGSQDVMRCLIRTYALNTTSLPSLCFAVLGKKPEMMSIMLNLCNPNNTLPFSDLTPLMLASMVGNKNMVTLLCCTESNVNAQSSLGQTALEIAMAWHDLHMKQIIRSYGKESYSSKVHRIQQIKDFENIIEILKKGDSSCNGMTSIVVEEKVNGEYYDSKNFFNISHSTSSSVSSFLDNSYTSSLTENLHLSNENYKFGDKAQKFSCFLPCNSIQGTSSTKRDSTAGLVTFISSTPKIFQEGHLKTLSEQNVMKDIPQCRNSSVLNSLLARELCYGIPTSKLGGVNSSVMDNKNVVLLHNTAPIINKQHNFLGLCDKAENITNSEIQISQKLQSAASPVCSTKKAFSFRSPSKHIPHNGNSNKSPLASISQKIF